MLVSDVISRASILLEDVSLVRWQQAEMFLWIASAQQEIVKYVPDSFSVTEVISLAKGTKQTIPTEGYRLLDIIRNMGTGSTPGQQVTITTKEALDAVRPLWHQDKGQEVEHYIYNPETDRKVFYVYPGLTRETKVEIIYSKNTPLNFSSTTDSLNIQDAWIESIVNYVVYRCLSKDTDYGNNSKGMSYGKMFYSSLGQERIAKSLTDPNRVISEQ